MQDKQMKRPRINTDIPDRQLLVSTSQLLLSICNSGERKLLIGAVLLRAAGIHLRPASVFQPATGSLVYRPERRQTHVPSNPTLEIASKKNDQI